MRLRVFYSTLSSTGSDQLSRSTLKTTVNTQNWDDPCECEAMPGCVCCEATSASARLGAHVASLAALVAFPSARYGAHVASLAALVAFPDLPQRGTQQFGALGEAPPGRVKLSGFLTPELMRPCWNSWKVDIRT